jgi:uncharacterized protein
MLKRALISLLFFPAIALAQETAPLIGSEATQPQTEQVAATPIDNVNRILVIGDAMAGGLGAGMARMAAGDARLQVVSRFNESSGITRPDIYDWASALPKIMEGKNFTSVVVLIGLNDSQDIRGAAGQFAFNSPEWIAAYKANTDLILDSLISQNVKVFWLGEPPMGDATYDAEMQQVAGLQKDRVVAKGATFIDTRPLLLSPEGAYVDFGPDDTGEMRKLRQKDGVTFFKQGNNKFAQLILNAIKTGAPSAAPVAAAAPAPQVDLPSAPVFGQADVNGTTVVAELGVVVPELRKIEPAQVGSSIVPAQGTAAEKLFATGEVTASPLGRFDDFSYEAPAAN